MPGQGPVQGPRHVAVLCCLPRPCAQSRVGTGIPLEAPSPRADDQHASGASFLGFPSLALEIFPELGELCQVLTSVGPRVCAAHCNRGKPACHPARCREQRCAPRPRPRRRCVPLRLLSGLGASAMSTCGRSPSSALRPTGGCPVRVGSPSLLLLHIRHLFLAPQLHLWVIV